MIETCKRAGFAALLLCALSACGDDDDGATMETSSGGKSGSGSAGKLASGGAGKSGSGGGDKAGSGASDAGAQQGSTDDFDPQLPPTTVAEVEAWLAEGFYKDWTCEDEPTAKTDGAPAIHAHGGKSLVCNNALLAKSTLKSGGQFPKGVASVKEILDATGKVTLTAVSVKIDADSKDGKGWYWYEGKALAGVGFETCTSCHVAAGSDADHPGEGDYVYFKN